MLQEAVGHLPDDLAARRADGDVADDLVQRGAGLPDGGGFLYGQRDAPRDPADRFRFRAIQRTVGHGGGKVFADVVYRKRAHGKGQQPAGEIVGVTLKIFVAEKAAL